MYYSDSGQGLFCQKLLVSTGQATKKKKKIQAFLSLNLKKLCWLSSLLLYLLHLWIRPGTAHLSRNAQILLFFVLGVLVGMPATQNDTIK